MTQIIAIHGGTTFADYDDYLEYLRTAAVSAERFMHAPSWKDTLQEVLGSDCQVLLPSMPDKTNAKYNEWKLWFDRVSEVAEDGCVLIGHSLGGIFLAKYLSENEFPKKIRGTIMVAAPYDDETSEDLTDFKIDSISDKFKSQAGEIVFFYGADDPVIPASEAEKYRAQLPHAEFNELSAPDHFVRPAFPEIIDRIRKLSS